MTNGFSVRETINRPANEVWTFMSNLEEAHRWMNGIEPMRRKTADPIDVGTVFAFDARGAERITKITAWEPGRQMALTSQQGGMTATYLYSVANGDDVGTTAVSLEATCEASGFFWKLLSPLIVRLMKQSDSGQLAQLKAVMDEA
ncbi:MAG: SRPBCC family protein [Chloroflexota bacterium]